LCGNVIEESEKFILHKFHKTRCSKILKTRRIHRINFSPLNKYQSPETIPFLILPSVKVQKQIWEGVHYS
jgi:hypothetical protein